MGTREQSVHAAEDEVDVDDMEDMDDVEARADRIVEAEQQLEDRRTRPEADTLQVDLDPRRLRSSGIRHCPVHDVEYDSHRGTDRVRITAQTPDGTAEFTLDAPEDDLGDTPLGALLDGRGVSPGRIADLDALPLTRREDDHWLLVTPPQRRAVRLETRVGGRRIAAPVVPTPRGVFDRLSHLASRLCLALPGIRPSDLDGYHAVDVDHPAAILYLPLFLSPVAAGLLLAGLTGALAGILATLLLVIVVGTTPTEYVAEE